MLAFSINHYGLSFRATQSVELFCAYVESCLSCFAFERLDRVCHALPRFNNRPILHLTIVFYHKYRGQGENEKVPKDQKRDWDEKSPI